MNRKNLLYRVVVSSPSDFQSEWDIFIPEQDDPRYSLLRTSPLHQWESAQKTANSGLKRPMRIGSFLKIIDKIESLWLQVDSEQELAHMHEIMRSKASEAACNKVVAVLLDYYRGSSPPNYRLADYTGKGGIRILRKKRLASWATDHLTPWRFSKGSQTLDWWGGFSADYQLVMS